MPFLGAPESKCYRITRVSFSRILWDYGYPFTKFRGIMGPGQENFVNVYEFVIISESMAQILSDSPIRKCPISA